MHISISAILLDVLLLPLPWNCCLEPSTPIKWTSTINGEPVASKEIYMPYCFVMVVAKKNRKRNTSNGSLKLESMISIISLYLSFLHPCSSFIKDNYSIMISQCADVCVCLHTCPHCMHMCSHTHTHPQACMFMPTCAYLLCLCLCACMHVCRCVCMGQNHCVFLTFIHPLQQQSI